jgi:hypothetical protein
MKVIKSHFSKKNTVKKSIKYAALLLIITTFLSFSQSNSNYNFSGNRNFSNLTKNICQENEDSLIFNNLDCSNAIPLTLNQTYHGNTAEGNSDVSVYNNDGFWTNTGKENVHSIDWPGGLMIVRLTDKSANLDPILLGTCDPGDYKSGRAHSKMKDVTLDSYLPKGSYYIIVDGWDWAEGSYQLTVMESGAMVKNDIYYIKDSTLYKIAVPSDIEIEKNVLDINKSFGYIVPGSDPLDGKEEVALYIKKTGEQKARLFYDGNFESTYLKQQISCENVRLDLFGSDVFKGEDIILENCDILRCENGYTLSHQLDGTKKLYRPENSQEPWMNIKQIITVDDATYFVKNDLTIWAINGTVAQVSQIGTNAHLLQDNDNQLILIDKNNNYFRWTAKEWISVKARYVSISPQITDEGFWFFIQPESILRKTDSAGKNLPLAEYKKGLYLNSENSPALALIPETGDCDKFLWRTKKLSDGQRILINKAKGENSPLIINKDGNFSSGKNGNENSWTFTEADRVKYGTTAFRFTSKSGKALSYSENTVQLLKTDNKDHNQIWVFHFNQMVKDYFLPLPNNENLDKYFLINTNKKTYKVSNGIVELSKSEKKDMVKVLKAAYPEIQASYNKFLKGDNGVNFFASNTCSDWALVNYYFIINNMMNAVNKPKPAFSGVGINNLSYMEGRNLIMINKNDLNANIPGQYFSSKFNPVFLATYRGGSSFRMPFTDAIITSEELTCKKGIVNRPQDKVFRKFNHGVHEFTHALAGICKWTDIVKKVYDEASDSQKKSICWDFEFNPHDSSPECICWMIQNWFNSGRNEHYPQSRTENEFKTQILEAIFNKDNTWMPPKAFRKNGYLPSGAVIKETDGNR